MADALRLAREKYLKFAEAHQIYIAGSTFKSVQILYNDTATAEPPRVHTSTGRQRRRGVCFSVMYKWFTPATRLSLVGALYPSHRLKRVQVACPVQPS